jgi:hypothetical protein
MKNFENALLYLSDSLFHKNSNYSFLNKNCILPLKNKVLKKNLQKNIEEVFFCNSILRAMITKGIVSKDSFLKIKNNKNYFDVLNEINPRSNDVIIDVGTGDGLLPLIIYKLEIPTTIYANEIEMNLVYRLRYGVKQIIKPQNKSSQLLIFKGSKKNTQLDKIKADKIVAINTIHHFKYMKDMMKSIRKSMTDSTKLLVVENHKSNSYDDITDLTGESKCKYALHRDGLIDLFRQYNFKIMKITKIRETMELFELKMLVDE